MSKKVAVLGGGIAGLSAASIMALNGFDVSLFEKNAEVGGRASKFEKDGFSFDMGPTWYWMPDIIEDFFQIFEGSAADHYELQRLDPSYRVFFGKNDFIDIPSSVDEIAGLFESLEKGAGASLRKYLREAEYKYTVGLKKFAFKPGLSILEFLDWRLMSSIFKLHMLKPFSSYVKKHFKHPYLIQLIEFHVLFLGAKPQNTPALFSLMSHADYALGTWYPVGGMHKIAQAMKSVAHKNGVNIKTNENIESINVSAGSVCSITANGVDYEQDAVIATIDYQHVDQKLLAPEHSSYSQAYWESRKLAPSCLIFHLALDKKIDNLQHHNLFFDADFQKHAEEIYDRPQWPENPLFYVCRPTVTDSTLAPEGKDILYLLIPVAVALDDTVEIREKYLKLLLERLEVHTGEDISKHILFKRSYAHKEFMKDYNSFKGNAYGLANTLMQTSIFKPKIKSKKLKNLYFAGQLTVPGPGIPPAIISGRIAADLAAKEMKVR
ncbi:MAG TPA: phytoene desaturase [Flavobacteriales bacterium]|nr:phytoene desaturase [Flavobacteriales bacterium]HIA12359.1 phytoene desaturase [Flavobacteriales bacterium]